MWGQSINFDEDGNISGVVAYLSSNPYLANNVYTFTTDDSPASAVDMVAQNIDQAFTANDATEAVMNLYRGESFFGFNSYYMAYIDWRATRTFDDLDDDKTIDRSYDYSGAMLTGIETSDADILDVGTFDFSGKGRGVYHNSNTGKGGQTIFDVTANVNFATSKFTINSSNSIACADFSNIGSCTHNFGNFSTGEISYEKNNVVSNNISGNVYGNIGAASLTGTLDARFYGKVAQELGGTFALTGNDYYYYGAFGAEGIYHNFSEEVTTHVDTPEEADFNSNNLTGFNDSNRGGKQNNALPFTAVQITENDNQLISEQTGGVVEFNFYSYGSLDSVQKLYFGDKKYEEINLFDGGGWDANFIAEDVLDAEAYMELMNSDYFYQYKDPLWRKAYIGSNIGNAPVNMGISKPYGSNFNYMALIQWNHDSGGTTGLGYGITGFETVTTPMISSATFIGYGRGQYVSSNNNGQNFYFDMVAVADFSNKIVNLASVNTCLPAEYQNDCTSVGISQHFLNFTGTLNYQAGNNNMSGDLVTTGDGYTNLTGTANARFYGPNVKEFGGTFNLHNNQEVYVGWFGGNVSDIVTTNYPSTPVIFNANNLTSFDDNSHGATVNNALKAMTVYIEQQTGGERPVTTKNIKGAVAEFDYDSNADFVSLSLYFDDTKFSTTTDARIYSRSINDATSVAVGSHNAPRYFRLGHAWGNLGFDAKYLAAITWDLQESGKNSAGRAIIGFETAGNAIPTAGNIRFTGRGSGYYFSKDTYNTLNTGSYITANIDFTTRNVNLVGTHNSYISHLDFTGLLSYDAGANIIIGAISSIGDAGNERLLGIAEARFYGPNREEFGGTFNLSNATAGYIGAFAADDITIITSISTPAAPNPNFNQNNLVSFTDDARKGTSGNKLLGMATTLTKNSDTTISNTGITTVAVEFAFTDGGDLTGHVRDSFTLHLPDRKYGTVNASGGSDSLTSTASNKTTHTDADGTSKSSGKADYLGFSKSSDMFGFTAEYMAVTRWRVSESNQEISGYAMAGFESEGSDIPSTGLISFTGEGHGRYYDNTAFATSNNTHNLAFTVTANVNFGTRNINLSTDHDGTGNDDLNLSGALSYVSGSNVITGAIETAGTGTEESKLKGTAEARFYGPAAEEFGGVFSTSNQDGTAGFNGYFGAKRP